MSVTDTTTPQIAAPPADPVRAALGDPATLDNLVRLARSKCPGNPTLVDDVVQVVCALALKKCASFIPTICGTISARCCRMFSC